MHFFYNKDTTYENFNNILKDDGRIIITDIWADETLDYFFKKIKEYNFKIEKQEDLSNKTIDSMNGDISKILMSHSKNVKEESINAFLTVQKNRLKLFYNNINKQIKFVLMKGKKMSFKKIKYSVLKNAISTELADFVYKYFLNKRNVAKVLFDSKYI